MLFFPVDFDAEQIRVKDYDGNYVRLCFQAVIMDKSPSKPRVLEPVLSIPISNSGSEYSAV